MPTHELYEACENYFLAYNRQKGKEPGIVFLSGLMSDMEGTKALHLDKYCRRSKRSYLRFDYSGHGNSSGEFTGSTVGDWYRETLLLLSEMLKGKPQILVGSSIGAWIALLIAGRFPNFVAGVVGVSSAPDFTVKLEENLSRSESEKLARDGYFDLHAESGGDPIPITGELLRDARHHLVFENRTKFKVPVRYLHSTNDREVPVDRALEVLRMTSGANVSLTLTNESDHRFSSEKCLKLIVEAIESIAK